MKNIQKYLENVSAKDKFGFLKNLVGENWSNHRVLLFLALELTNNFFDERRTPVVEYGAGGGSTEYLRKYCLDNDRAFLTYDSNEEWAEKNNSVFIEDWGTSDVFDGKFSVALLDLAPGYYRKRALDLLRGKCEIIVVHDTELYGAGDYQIEEGLKKFRYRINYNITQGGAGATAVSDTIDLNVFDKCTLNEYLLEVL